MLCSFLRLQDSEQTSWRDSFLRRLIENRRVPPSINGTFTSTNLALETNTVMKLKRTFSLKKVLQDSGQR